jgi:hypothetical protein
MACPEGLEPPACCLEGSCSIQLSYGQFSSLWDARTLAQKAGRDFIKISSGELLKSF